MRDHTELNTASNEPFMEYRYIGKRDANGHPLGFIMGVPARDLYAPDVLCAQENQGVTRAQIEASVLYEPVHLLEIAPMCGAELTDGGQCKRVVTAWGQRCWQHTES